MKTVSVICGLALCLFNVIAAQRLYDSECDGNVDIRYIGEELAKLRKLFVEEMAKLRVDISRVQQSDTSKQYTEEEMTILKKSCVAEMAKLSQNTKSTQSCPPQWVPYRNSCYFFGNDYGNWNQGKVRCEQKHGSSKYVRITSQEEDTFLRNIARSKGITEYASRDYWIGGTDASRDGVFMWEGYSQNFSYTNWGPGNPDRVGTPDCVILFQRSDYKWHDTSCSNNNSYICEIEL